MDDNGWCHEGRKPRVPRAHYFADGATSSACGRVLRSWTDGPPGLTTAPICPTCHGIRPFDPVTDRPADPEGDR